MKGLCFFSLLLFIPMTVHAHMGNKFGPNGGYIKMPGAFHTELVDKKATFDIYLLDLNFKPLANNQNDIELSYADLKTKKNHKLTCQYIEQKYFSCAGKKISRKSGQLVLNIKQLLGKQMNVSVNYDLPLKLDK